jgi:hypothetical protein
MFPNSGMRLVRRRTVVTAVVFCVASTGLYLLSRHENDLVVGPAVLSVASAGPKVSAAKKDSAAKGVGSLIGRSEDVAWERLGYAWKHHSRDMAPFVHAPSLPTVNASGAPAWAYLQFRVRKALGDLARLYMSYHKVPEKGSIRIYNDSTWQMGWWPDYVALTGDTVVRDYCYAWRDSFIHSVKNEVGEFSKGYVKRGDIDHQNEDLVRFLLRLRSIDPDDQANSYNVRAMAPLLGNWRSDVPDWYDYEKHRWRGYWLGTEYVKEEESPPDLSPFAWLCLMALEAHRATGDAKYLELVEDFCTHQAADIDRRKLKNSFLGVAVYGGSFGRANFYGETYGFGPWRGASFRLNGGLIGAYVDLYQLTGKKQYLKSARVFLDHTMPDMLYHTRGMSGLGQVCRYRRITGDDTYDAGILRWLETTRDRVDSLHTITEPCDPAERKTDWLHGCETRNSPSPTTFNLAYLITGDSAHLDRAVEMALDRVRAIYSEEYRTSTRVRAAGDWNWFSYIMAWEVADAFFPTVGKQYGGSNANLDRFEVRFAHAGGEQGLPAKVAAQYLPRAGDLDQRPLRFYNVADEEIVVRVRPIAVKPFVIESVKGRDAAATRVDGHDVLVTLPPHHTVEISIHRQ